MVQNDTTVTVREMGPNAERRDHELMTRGVVLTQHIGVSYRTHRRYIASSSAD
jgi:hypothetical protein